MQPDRSWRRRFAPGAVRVLAFTAATLGFLRCVPSRAMRGRHDLRDAKILLVGLCLGALACIPGPSRLPARTLIILIAFMTAVVEEYIFRRRLPNVLEGLFNHDVPREFAWSISVVAAQVAFAACHFVTAGHAPPFGDGFPILRIFAAECFLAVIVAFAGLATGVLIHAATNVLIQTRIAGTFTVPTSQIILTYSALAIACIAITGAMRSTVPSATLR